MQRSVCAALALCMFWPAEAPAQEQAQVETVVVTGTRIPRPAYDLPSPVATMSSEEIQHSGTTNLADYLKRVPSLAGSLGDFQTSGYNTPAANDLSSLGGLNLLDLRNLGYVRTLVLIDGHRTVSESTGSAAVDVDSIPISLTDRVDVTTGGASAVYGADGVSGVVNFVMKHDLEGVHLKVQGGTSEDGGGAKFIETLSAGRNFDDGKGNVSVAYEGAEQNRLYFTDRDFTDVGGFTSFVPNPFNRHDNRTHLIPDFIPTSDAQFIFSAPMGAITTILGHKLNPKDLPNYLGNGDAFDVGTYLHGGVSIGSDGMPFAQDLQGDFQPRSQRNIGQFSVSYEFSPQIRVNGSLQYAGIDTTSISYPTFDDTTALLPDNAFISPVVAAAMMANKKHQGILSEDYLQLRNGERVKRDTYRSVLEVSGALPQPSFLDKLRYDASAVYGRTDVDDIQLRNRVEDRFFAALDSVIDPATGKPTCRSNLDPSARPPDLRKLTGVFQFTDTDTLDPSLFPFTFKPGPNSGCVPFNPFDPNFDNSASIAFMTTNTHTKGEITQTVLNGYFGADVPVFEHLGFAKPLSVVLGGEYRRETSAATPDHMTQSGFVWIGGSSPVRGDFDVTEGFAEASLPILADEPFAKELSIEGAVRQSHYSTAGDSTSWKLGGIWSPVEGLKLRATDAVAVRAPNIGELFAPLEHGFDFINDPCDKLYIHQGTDFRKRNCNLIEHALGYTEYKAGKTSVQTDQSTPAIIGGNTALMPETARTLTAGAVIQPDWVPGLVFSIDWYQVHIANAIEAPSAQSVADECVDLSTIDNPFCAAVTRTLNKPFKGSISLVVAQEINVASFETDGVDVSLSYHLDTKDITEKDWGSLDFHLIGSWLDGLSTVPLPGEDAIESANTYNGGVDGGPAPRAQANMDIVWTWDPVTIDYNVDWYNAVYSVDRQTLISEPDVYAKQYLHIPAHFVQSVQADYEFSDGWDVYAGIDNLFYQKPSIGQNGLPVEPLGRFFYLGVKADLDWGALKF